MHPACAVPQVLLPQLPAVLPPPLPGVGWQMLTAVVERKAELVEGKQRGKQRGGGGKREASTYLWLNIRPWLFGQLGRNSGLSGCQRSRCGHRRVSS